MIEYEITVKDSSGSEVGKIFYHPDHQRHFLELDYNGNTLDANEIDRISNVIKTLDQLRSDEE